MYEVGIPARQRPAMWEANVEGTRRVMEAAVEEQVPRIVYVSTVGIFGNTHKKVVDESYENPETDFTSYYEETKLEAHKVVQRMIEEIELDPRRRHRISRRQGDTTARQWVVYTARKRYD